MQVLLSARALCHSSDEIKRNVNFLCILLSRYFCFAIQPGHICMKGGMSGCVDSVMFIMADLEN